jgi:hypothetical protein
LYPERTENLFRNIVFTRTVYAYGTVREDPFSGDTLREAGEILDSTVASHLNNPFVRSHFARDVAGRGTVIPIPETSNNP